MKNQDIMKNWDQNIPIPCEQELLKKLKKFIHLIFAYLLWVIKVLSFKKILRVDFKI